MYVGILYILFGYYFFFTKTKNKTKTEFIFTFLIDVIAYAANNLKKYFDDLRNKKQDDTNR